ncbi:unnamed protein product [Rotaria sordida]|uniref:Uncharacterized protein n=1 Tax=Rotaria sordida TaxID=392033 RepID=A0A814JEN0_9BILA|nr:unnamed protein product [Rotaria sordida]CAF4204244.1 unnamed protein product [Rotaria sordida]
MMLDRFLQILPEIHNEIKWLDLHSSSMKDILCAVDYPNLYGLGLYNIDAESIQYLLTDLSGQTKCFNALEEYFPYAKISYPIICSRTLTELLN